MTGDGENEALSVICISGLLKVVCSLTCFDVTLCGECVDGAALTFLPKVISDVAPSNDLIGQILLVCMVASEHHQDLVHFLRDVTRER